MPTSSWSGERTSFPPGDRKRILQRDPTCQCNGCHDHDGPCTKPSTEADHVIPVAEHGTDDWDTNGQGLCTGCHGWKTTAEQARGRARKAHKRPPEPHPGMR